MHRQRLINGNEILFYMTHYEISCILKYVLIYLNNEHQISIDCQLYFRFKLIIFYYVHNRNRSLATII